MGSATGMIKEARADLGMGEPNSIQRWYAKRNGSAYSYNFPWCDGAVTKWAVDSDNHDAVCFGKDYAYTVAHASRFKSEGRWHKDVAGIRAGDIVFFDWSGSNSIGAIDHVGVVEYVKGSAVHTIEGNTGDRCRRRVRDRSTIVGYGRPRYGKSSGASKPKPKPAEKGKAPAFPLPRGHYFGPSAGAASHGGGGSHRDDLRRWQRQMQERGWRLTADGLYGRETRRIATQFQREKRLQVDGLIGSQTWRAAWTEPIT